ncbi:hypothetical protein M3592_27500 [Priestia aryabhattai]|uniref:hypothetical protein n=1 Tax=Priestia TaxID=2800373 RepID=UPI00204098FE|nr:hypothetical protein [Priestia aryabhattai]MCM2979145.1 hypothetical protein [Priestia aryabhattai]
MTNSAKIMPLIFIFLYIVFFFLDISYNYGVPYLYSFFLFFFLSLISLFLCLLKWFKNKKSFFLIFSGISVLQLMFTIFVYLLPEAGTKPLIYEDVLTKEEILNK